MVFNHKGSTISNSRQGETIRLDEHSKVAVVGGGPAGSMFSSFFLDLAGTIGLDGIKVDLYEPQTYTRLGPTECNHCGGIVSESLVQLLAMEGITIPDNVVQRGLDSYVMHVDFGNVAIKTPLDEKRIAAMHRGAGPLGTQNSDWSSFDRFLLDMAQKKGARWVQDRVTQIEYCEDKVAVTSGSEGRQTYDLVVGAVGLKRPSLGLFEGMGFGYGPPMATKTFICEFQLGEEKVLQYFGDSMHVFLLDIPRLKFGALIPKGDFVTLALLGKSIDKELVDSFLSAPQVVQCFPEGQDIFNSFPCRCFPQINVRGAKKPFADRIVLIGDSGISRLYKNGIGAAYITSKAATRAALLHGISEQDFRMHYWPVCRNIERDNFVGKLVFLVTHVIQTQTFLKRGLFRAVVREGKKPGSDRIMSTVLWDTFTGSAAYREIFQRALRPSCWGSLIWESIRGIRFSRDKG